MKFFSQEDIESILNYPGLINKLEASFRQKYIVPPRLHYTYKSGARDEDSTLLLMPAWKNERYVGIKIITVSPYNIVENKATIQGIFLLMNAKSGQVIAQFDAKSLTNRRTAASSALASRFLSRSDANTLLMLGTGALAPEMIKAHCSVRLIKEVFVWGRNHKKAQELTEKLDIDGIAIKAITTVDDYIREADIISAATRSQEPLIFGDNLVSGQHIDLVGAFKPTWREADDNVIRRASVFVDTREGALKESGELLIPMKKKLFSADNIKGDLFDLCGGGSNGRMNPEEISCFVSVGYALEDLAAAEMVFEYQLK